MRGLTKIRAMTTVVTSQPPGRGCRRGMCPHFMKLKSNGDSQRLYRVAQFISLTQDRETYEVVQLALHDTLVTQ